jgi:hypothetical protein
MKQTTKKAAAIPNRSRISTDIHKMAVLAGIGDPVAAKEIISPQLRWLPSFAMLPLGWK